jgi:hypothetical protein
VFLRFEDKNNLSAKEEIYIDLACNLPKERDNIILHFG